MVILRFDGRTWRDRAVVLTSGTSGIGREFVLRVTAVRRQGGPLRTE